MLDRETIVAVLKKRFAGASMDQVAAATDAIVGLEDEWEELAIDADPCSTTCYLTVAMEPGDRITPQLETVPARRVQRPISVQRPR